jgi:hypothetical protein
MAEIKPDSSRLSDLIKDIEGGVMKVPAFQREFVWPMSLTLKLLDSIARGYPIGTLLFWETDRRLGSMRNIGNAALHDTPEGRLVRYVLDGQQRLTSLFAAVKAATVSGRSYEVLVDLDSTDDSEALFFAAHAPEVHQGEAEEAPDGGSASEEQTGDEEYPAPAAANGRRFVSVADLLVHSDKSHIV